MSKREWVISAAMAAAGWMTMASIGTGQGGSQLPFSGAKILVEFNATADDVGVQVLLDGEPWKNVKIFGPDDRQILDITGQNSLGTQGLTELFFESSEPSLDDVPINEFFDRFPEGEYAFEGATVDGIPMTGTAMLSHVIPSGPEILMPASHNDSPPVVNPFMMLIEWEPVTESIDGSGVEITGYQVIVEQVDPRRIFDIVLPASVTSLVVPPEFFAQRNTLHKFEVLAIDASGNQTITEGSFVTAP